MTFTCKWTCRSSETNANSWDYREFVPRAISPVLFYRAPALRIRNVPFYTGATQDWSRDFTRCRQMSANVSPRVYFKSHLYWVSMLRCRNGNTSRVICIILAPVRFFFIVVSLSLRAHRTVSVSRDATKRRILKFQEYRTMSGARDRPVNTNVTGLPTCTLHRPSRRSSGFISLPALEASSF